MDRLSGVLERERRFFIVAVHSVLVARCVFESAVGTVSSFFFAKIDNLILRPRILAMALGRERLCAGFRLSVSVENETAL